MEQRPEYEQLIAGKLESLPLPDMADAIWARIEAQLDLDMPTDEGSGSSPDAPSGWGIPGWELSVVVVAALITVFLLLKNNSKKNQPITTTPFQNKEQKAPPSSTAKDPPGIAKPNTVRLSPQPTDKDKTALPAIPDTVAQLPLSAAAPAADSTGTTNEQSLVAAPEKKDTLPTKKRRGVTGLSDEEYRIAPKKKEEE